MLLGPAGRLEGPAPGLSGSRAGSKKLFAPPPTTLTEFVTMSRRRFPRDGLGGGGGGLRMPFEGGLGRLGAGKGLGGSSDFPGTVSGVATMGRSSCKESEESAERGGTSDMGGSDMVVCSPAGANFLAASTGTSNSDRTSSERTGSMKSITAFTQAAQQLIKDTSRLMSLIRTIAHGRKYQLRY